MDIAEWARTCDQLMRERTALEESYQDFEALMREQAERKRGKGGPPIDSDAADVIRRLLNYVQMEREQNARLFALLVESMVRLAEAYDLELPPGWPPPQ